VSRPFRLAGLLRLRAISEDQAAAELARRTRQRDAAERARRHTQDALGDAIVPDGTDALGLKAVIASRMALSGLLVQHGETVACAQVEVEQADQEWARARSATRTLEKLEERHTEAERAAEQHAEQAVLDEIAGRRRPGGTVAAGTAVVAGAAAAVAAASTPEEER
jgi:flagellar FliJ protein